MPILAPVAAALALSSQPVFAPPIIPKPVKATYNGKLLAMTARPSIVDRTGGTSFGKLFAARVAKYVPASSRKGARVVFELDAKAAELKDEGYRLTIGSREIRVIARKPAGLFYGEQTLLQMLPQPRSGEGPRWVQIALPQGEIVDWPRFPWRGLHIDCSRHFFTVDEIKQYIDYMAMLKLNVFHWHLIDEGGWRMEVKKYPKLTSVGAWRVRTPEVWGGKLEFPGPDSGADLYGGYYTQAQIREVVAYAARRHITTVPEIEMPGHILPAIWAYPELGCNVKGNPPTGGFPTYAFCIGKESTYQFLRDVLDETMALFPSKIIHIGGDEVNQRQWMGCPDCQPFLRRWSLKDGQEAQSFFLRRIEGFLNARGRTLMGWDEILEGGLAPKAMVMSWRGTAGGIEAAHAGHPVVMSPTSHCYFDYSYATIPTEKVYGFDPVPWELKDGSAKLVLGGQANIWTEWMADFKRVQYMIFPRVLAMSEALWTPVEAKQWPDFESRLNQWYPRLQAMKVDFHIAPPTTPVGLTVLKDGVATVAFAGPKVPGSELRYSIGDSGVWKTYQGPIKVRQAGTVLAKMFIGGAPVADTASVSVIEPVRRNGSPQSPGLRQQFFEGNHPKMPDFDPEAGTISSVQKFEIDLLKHVQSFAMYWTGYLRIETEGIHSFTLGSDDGSKLWIGGAVAIDNDRQQPYTEKTSAVFLIPGIYSIRIGYFEAGGGDGFHLFHQAPGGGKRELQPSDFLLP